MINPVKGIHQWNKDSGLLDRGENRALESSMLLEEVYEGMGIPNAKEAARLFVSTLPQNVPDLQPVSDADWLDHLCDLEFILHGSKAKMGLSPQQDTASIQAVLTANKQKLKAGQDSSGKQLKPANFVGPGVELQKILDKRG